jgi:hypothetical protein
MQALKTIYDYVGKLDAAPIFADQYLEIVEDWYQTRIGFDGQGYWVENNGFLRTLRFNGIKHVDMQRSQGVIGYLHSENNQTYIHLDGSKKRKIYLAEKQPAQPYIIQATQFIDELQATSAQLNFVYRGFGKTLIKIGGLKPDIEYQLSLTATDQKTVKISLIADQAGIITFRTLLDPPQTRYLGTLTATSEKHD